MMTRQRLGSFKAGAAMLAVLGMTTTAWANAACPRPRELAALKTAAIQQQLMVAALTCKQTRLYNRFVIAYRGDLQRSDTALRHFFEHRSGVAAYHAFKTKLANDASLRSIHDNEGYCAQARATFDDALNGPDASLVDLASGVPAAAVLAGTGCSAGVVVARRASE